MARYTGAVCRLCRREGTKLFLKGDRCFKPSCAIDKRGTFPPGQHGREARRTKLIGYGEQLREKQKVRRMYGLLERQFALTFEEAARRKGVTGEALLTLLERRLDNVVYRLGFAMSRAQARQLVSHGHILVKRGESERRVNIPSFLVRPGDEISVAPAMRSNVHVQEAIRTAVGRTGRPAWLELVDSENCRGRVVALPTRSDIPYDIREQLIVELYSK